MRHEVGEKAQGKKTVELNVMVHDVVWTLRLDVVAARAFGKS